MDENKYYIIGFIVGTILLTGIISGYRSWDNGVKEKQTAQLIAMQEAENYPENIIAQDDLNLRSGLRGIALLQGATAALDKDQNENARALYERAINDKGIPKDLRNIAVLISARLTLQENEDIDAAKAKALAEQLETVGQSKTIWSAHAKIDAAAIYANLLDNPTRAADLTGSIGEGQKLPESLLKRANSLTQLYKSQASSKSAE